LHGFANVHAVSTPILLKGSLFDVIPLGAIDFAGPLPQAGDVLECDGKSYTVTDLIKEDGSIASPTDEGQNLIAIVEPLAVSQRRGAAMKSAPR
jgi:hypothetical protein